jgi:hypothetical protein
VLLPGAFVVGNNESGGTDTKGICVDGVATGIGAEAVGAAVAISSSSGGPIASFSGVSDMERMEVIVSIVAALSALGVVD